MRRRLFKILRRVGIGFLVLMFLLLMWAWWGRPLEDLAEWGLGEQLGAEVRIGDIDLDLPRGFTVHDLEVFAPGVEGGDPVLAVPEIAIGVKSLVGGPVTSVRVQSPHVILTEDAEGRLDLQDLLRPRNAGVRVPQVQVFDAVLELRGDGPRCQALSRSLAAGVEARVAVPQCEVLPSVDPGSWTVRGEVVAAECLTLLLEGRGVVAGRTDLQLTMERAHALDLDSPELRQRLTGRLADWLDVNQAHGRVMGSLRLGWDPGQAPDRRLDLALLDCEVTPAQFPVPMKRARGDLSWEGQELLLEEVIARHGRTTVDLEGALSTIFEPGTLTLTLAVRDGGLTPEVRTALDRVPGLTRFLNAMKADGVFHGEVRLTLTPDGRLESSLDVQVVDGRVVFVGFDPLAGEERRGFPLPVRNIQGSVHKTLTGLHFEHLGGVTDSGARVAATGHFQQDGEELVGSLFLRATDLVLDQAFREACTQLGGQEADLAFRRHGLAGTVDLELDLTVGKGGQVDWQVDLIPQELLLRTELFPFPLVVDAGIVRLKDGRVDLLDLRARHASATNPVRLDLSGHAVLGADAPFVVDVVGRRLALDEDLVLAVREAGLEQVHQTWEQLGPEGQLDLELRIAREDWQQPWQLSGRVSPAGVDLFLPRWTVPLRGLRGDLQLAWQEGSDFVGSTQGLVAELLGGEVFIKGDYSTAGKGAVEVRGGRLRVQESRDPNSGSVLTALEALEPAAAELLKEVRPSGRIRALCRLQCDGAQWRVETVQIGPDLPARVDASTPDGLSLHLRAAPRRVIWNGGVLRGVPDSGRWEFENVTASIGGASIVLREGLLRSDDQGLTLECQGTLGALPLDAFLFAVLPEGQRPVLRRFETVGLTHTDLSRLSMYIPTGAALPTELDVEAEVELSACGLLRGNGFQDLNGRLRVQVRREGGGLTRATGTLRGGSLRVGDLPFHAIEARLELVGETLEVKTLGAEFAGGRLVPQENHWTFPLDGRQPYVGDFLLRGLQLDRLFGVGNPRTRDWAGQVDVDLRFRGVGASLSNLEAVGKAEVKNGQLWNIPIFDRLYSLGISRLLGQSEPPTFHSGVMTVAMKSGVINILDLSLEGPALELHAEGALGPSGLDLHVYPNVVKDLPWVDIPLLGSLVAGLFSLVERETLSFRFEGPYQNPRVRWDPVSVRPRSDFAQGLDRPRLADPPSLLSRTRY